MIKCPRTGCRSPSYSKRRAGEIYTCNACGHDYTPAQSLERNQKDKEKPKPTTSGKKGKTYQYKFRELKRDPFDHMNRAMLIR